MANQYLLTRVPRRDLHLRAADADRERIAGRLRQSHAEGRLDLTEFQERLERCYAAKTLGDLSELVGDLPASDDEVERPRLDWLHARRWYLVPLVPLVLALLVISALTGHHHDGGGGWLWIPVVFLFLRLSWWRRRRWPAGARHGSGEWS